jgi:hypothetical protein
MTYNKRYVWFYSQFCVITYFLKPLECPKGCVEFRWLMVGELLDNFMMETGCSGNQSCDWRDAGFSQDDLESLHVAECICTMEGSAAQFLHQWYTRQKLLRQGALKISPYAWLHLTIHVYSLYVLHFIYLFILFIYSHVCTLFGSFYPCPLPPPSLPLPPHFQGEPVLCFSPVVLKSRHKQ